MTKPYISVVSVKPLPDYRLQVVLSDGRRGIYDMSPMLDRGVFKELKDPAYFARAKVFGSAVGWPNEQDISPFSIAEGMHPLPRRKTSRLRESIDALQTTISCFAKQHSAAPLSASRNNSPARQGGGGDSEMPKTNNSGCCAFCGYGFEVNRITPCQICGVRVRYLKCSNPEKAHHVAFEKGYPEVQKKHSHIEWELKGAIGDALMKSVKRNSVKDAEEIIVWIAPVVANMRPLLDYKDRDGITILEWVYNNGNPQMVQLFERYI